MGVAYVVCKESDNGGNQFTIWTSTFTAETGKCRGDYGYSLHHCDRTGVHRGLHDSFVRVLAEPPLAVVGHIGLVLATFDRWLSCETLPSFARIKAICILP
jgi:hypothetical protein